jgi:regulator of ribonuclease activity B
MSPNLPVDSDGNTLRSLQSHGSDLSRPMKIEFAIAVPDAESGKAIAEKVTQMGFQPDVYHNSKTGKWTCYCAKTIIPTYEEIIAIQSQLDEVSSRFGGKSDGWGSFGNAEVAQET